MAKNIRKSTRKAGDPLPSMISSDRVLRALDGIKTPDEFLALYDATARPRGFTPRQPNPKHVAAFERFIHDYDYDAFVKSVKVKHPDSLLARLVKHHAATLASARGNVRAQLVLKSRTSAAKK